MARKSKFTDKIVIYEEPKKQEVKKEVKGNSEIIKKGEKEFKKCLKCGWIHTADTEKCRFCGNRL